MDAGRKIPSLQFNVPRLVLTRRGSSQSDTSVSPSELEQMIASNCVHDPATDDNGFESMRSDATNLTTAGINTLYLQAKATSSPSLLTDIPFIDAPKSALDGLELSQQESGIGISPADVAEPSAAYSSFLVVPPELKLTNPRWSLNSSLEGGEEDDEACQISVYTAPDNRVERQLYSLDGNRRSSFETVYCPPVVSEQVVRQVAQTSSKKPAVHLPDDSRGVLPAKEVSSPQIPRRNPPPSPSTSVTTSISEIISSPPSEKDAEAVRESSVETLQLEGACRRESDASTAPSVDQVVTQEVEVFAQTNHSQSERSGVGNRYHTDTTVISSALGNTSQSFGAKAQDHTPRVAARPRITERSQAAIVNPVSQQFGKVTMPVARPSDDCDWASKVQQIAQWQADVNLAMQGANRSFIASPTDDDDEFEVLNVPGRRPKPLRRKSRQQPIKMPENTQHQPLQQQFQPFTRGPEPANHNESRLFGGLGRPITSISPIPTKRQPTLLTTSPQNGSHEPAYFRTPPTNVYQNVGAHYFREPISHPPPQMSTFASPQSVPRPKVDSMGYGSGGSRHRLSGYAEALSLATAANAAVRDAFNQRVAVGGEMHVDDLAT
uniref:BRCT domain-containing protein n=2 Tax=Mesocestoides corti TaxID=53468 RepID=A0A5K3FFJ7_MESCO